MASHVDNATLTGRKLHHSRGRNLTEQGKAMAASNTMAGFGLLVGGIPLILAHVFVLMFLLMIGVSHHSRPVVGVLLALVAVVITSALGIAVNQLVWSGDLFTMSADHA